MFSPHFVLEVRLDRADAATFGGDERHVHPEGAVDRIEHAPQSCGLRLAMPLDREDGTAAGEREAVLKQADLVAPSLAALHRVVGVDEFGKLRLALDARTLGQGIDIDGRHRKGPERVGPVGEKQCGRLESARPFGKARERSGGVIEDGEDGGADRAVFQKTERRLSEPRTQHAVLEREVRAERHARLGPVAVVLKAHHRRGAGGLSRRCARILKSSRTGSC